MKKGRKKSCGWCTFWKPKLWVHQLGDNKYPIAVEKGECCFENKIKTTYRYDYCGNIVYMNEEHKRILLNYILDLRDC